MSNGQHRRMRAVAAWSLLLSAPSILAATHCTPGETVAFSCAVGSSKVVSLCLAKGQRPGSTHLSYRFGPVGAPELVYPVDPAGSLKRFRYAHYFRYQVDRTEVSFSNAGVDYTVFDEYEGEQSPSPSRGVRVTVKGKVRELACRGQVVSRLMQLEPLLPCDAESALGNCR